MKMVHPELTVPIINENTFCTEWIIESPHIFTGFVQELYSQFQGNSGKYVLSEKDKILDLSKSGEIIINPFAIDINDKKIIGKLYNQLKNLAVSEEYYLYTQEMIQAIYKYVLDLEQKTNHILYLEKEIDWNGLFKAVGVRHESFDENFIQSISRYIKVSCDVFQTKLIVFVNLRSYLSDKEIQEILNDVHYWETHILLIENQERCCLKETKRYIIDKDLCEIY